jgi:hypothetical protein
MLLSRPRTGGCKMSLKSELFRGDKQLEACAVSDPAHVWERENSVGDHVTKIQHALVVLDCAMIKIKSEEISAQRYGPSTAAAVLDYKTGRSIINKAYQTSPDNIVGKMTIAKMDKEMSDREAEIPELIRRARVAAFQRCFTAFLRTGGLGPAPPPGRFDPNLAARVRARSIAIDIFGQPNPNLDDIADGIAQMRNFLASPNMPIVRALVNEKQCAFRDGFVPSNRLPVTLCANFFAVCTTDEERIRTMVHEAAHLIGVGASEGELYYLKFNCRNEDPQIAFGSPTSRERIDQADTWGKFVHCVSGQPPDKDDVIKRRT